MNLLKLPQVKAKTGLGTSFIYEAMQAGTFPRPVVQARDKHGLPRSVAWVEDEIDAWVAARIAERDGHAPPKSRRGRPKGSRNRKTLEQAAAAARGDDIAA